MSVDLFLIEAPHEIPEEYKAWELAKDEHKAVLMQALEEVLKSGEDSPQSLALDAKGKQLAARAIELETAARAAWLWGSNRAKAAPASPPPAAGVH